MINHRFRTPGLNAQRGAALFVSLMMLLLLTIIALAAMQGTLLQERMSSNFLLQTNAFQTAEQLLRARAQFATDNAFRRAGALALQGVMEPVRPGESKPWQGWLSGQVPPPADQRVITEFIDRSQGLCGLDTGSAEQCKDYWRITSYGVAGDPAGGRGAVVVLQEIFVP